MYLFVNDYILRESCSDCYFKGYNRVSDITLGDFWGIQKIDSEMDDNKGTSLVLTHDAKGESLLKKIAGHVKLKQVTLEQTSKENLSLLQSSVHRPSRNKVLKKIESENFQAHSFKKNSPSRNETGMESLEECLKSCVDYDDFETICSNWNPVYRTSITALFF